MRPRQHSSGCPRPTVGTFGDAATVGSHVECGRLGRGDSSNGSSETLVQKSVTCSRPYQNGGKLRGVNRVIRSLTGADLIEVREGRVYPVILEMRRSQSGTDWVFPSATKSGHIEQSTIRKRHAQACQRANLAQFPVYTLRHTCLTRWAAHMDPYTLAYLAGHSDFATTRRYVHSQSETVLAAMEKVRTAKGGHTPGHTDQFSLLDSTPASGASGYQ